MKTLEKTLIFCIQNSPNFFATKNFFFFATQNRLFQLYFEVIRLCVTIKTCKRTMICQTHQQPTSTNNMVVFFISDFDTLTLLADGTEPKIPSSHQPSPYMGLWYIGSLFYLSSICSSAFGGAFRTTRCLPD